MRSFITNPGILAMALMFAKSADDGEETAIVPMDEHADEDEDTLLDLELDSTPRMTVAPHGTEALVRVTSAKIKTFDSGARAIQLRCETEELGEVPEGFEDLQPEQIKTFYHLIWLPKADATGRQKAETNERIISDCEGFGVSTSGPLRVSEFTDQTAWVRLSLKGSPDDQYGEQQGIQRFVR